MFTNDGGAPIRYDNWRRRVWLPATRAAGCEGAGFPRPPALGGDVTGVARVDVKTAQVRLGHSDPRLTPAVYAAAPEEADGGS